jgi:hypothetical protein
VGWKSCCGAERLYVCEIYVQYDTDLQEFQIKSSIKKLQFHFFAQMVFQYTNNQQISLSLLFEYELLSRIAVSLIESTFDFI